MGNFSILEARAPVNVLFSLNFNTLNKHKRESYISMAVPFPDLDPYEVLKVSTDADEQEIKRSYRKLCLLHHPDKLQGKSSEEQDASRSHFEKIQFAHSILTDGKKRKRYDQTGSLDDIGDGEFDWFEYFANTKAEITEDNIKKDKQVYQGSEEEGQDIIEAWITNDGEFLKLFETIPHTDVTLEEEQRLFALVEKLLEDEIIESTDKWARYKKKRRTNFNKYLKSQTDESHEAEQLKKEIVGNKRKLDSEDDLRQLIQSRKKQSMDDLISRLESKYSNTKKRGKKSKKDAVEEPSEEEFQRARERLGKKRSKGK